MNSKDVNIEYLFNESIGLLKKIIQTSSISGQEEQAASLIESFFTDRKISVKRSNNNVWVYNKYYDRNKPTILINSHLDTVKPGSSWTFEPFKATEKSGKIYGLGSNDASGALVSLVASFLYFYEKTGMKYNLVFAATAEEETSGPNSICSIIDQLGPFEMAIVGEPTGMEMAIAEKGLLVLYCQSNGITGHAARGNGVNAIDGAIKDILWFQNYTFPRESSLLGPVKMTVTGINAGIQHNVIPDKCTFMVDIRSTDAYSNSEIQDIIEKNISSEITRISNRLNPSSIENNHPLVVAAKNLKIPLFASPTLSDQSQLSVPSVKIGPGESSRSHTADEYILISEIRDGVDTYIRILEKIIMD